MHPDELDLNLLRVFDALNTTRSVTAAAEQLGLSQPATSHGLTRLRTLLHDPLFIRTRGTMSPTPTAIQLSGAVRQALMILERALQEAEAFVPEQSTRVFRLRMSDITEAVFLPKLIEAMRVQASKVSIETVQWQADDITQGLDTGKIDFAFGHLPGLTDLQKEALFEDHNVIVVNKKCVEDAPNTSVHDMLRTFEYVAVRSHPETLRVLEKLGLKDRLKLTTSNFLALPSILRYTDLAAVMPRSVAMEMSLPERHSTIEPDVPMAGLTVSLHWSSRYNLDPANIWFRQLISQINYASFGSNVLGTSLGGNMYE